MKSTLWNFAPGIIQADGEGFKNEDGYHILRRFGDNAKGAWWMGILAGSEWRHFQMDLGNSEYREGFFEGRIPMGAKLA